MCTIIYPPPNNFPPLYPWTIYPGQLLFTVPGLLYTLEKTSPRTNGLRDHWLPLAKITPQEDNPIGQLPQRTTRSCDNYRTGQLSQEEKYPTGHGQLPHKTTTPHDNNHWTTTQEDKYPTGQGHLPHRTTAPHDNNHWTTTLHDNYPTGQQPLRTTIFYFNTRDNCSGRQGF